MKTPRPITFFILFVGWIILLLEVPRVAVMILILVVLWQIAHLITNFFSARNKDDENKS
jgi:hypothetical protein